MIVIVMMLSIGINKFVDQHNTFFVFKTMSVNYITNKIDNLGRDNRMRT